ncbi:HTH-type transcriptional repressor PurR [Paenibacillus plantiphilus]|uniref:HTH-type transcriptional repressor PurR n=1 Tax=Paenibacillus plantiphilus TaxID=2905650 RepID=A0ABN8GT12_9BACL|nr:LacI family DNA-binding transcriptional regulator [Paenibacillus plantiphilus]CAH1217457.1 HTH-type transcriptional repressor PurR [Paenibacillus plantiphilus]
MIVISTIKDVALLAGVSPATVSRVITNKGNIASDTKAKVLSAMEQINYVPTQSSIAQSKPGTISFSIARNPIYKLTNPFFSDVLFGISNAARRYDYNVNFQMAHTVEEQIANCIKLYKGKQVDGFIFTSVLRSDKDLLLKSMLDREIPFVMIGTSLNHHVFSIHNDNIRDSYMATKFLIEKGYQKILFLTNQLKQDVMYDRIHGYQRAVEEHGLDTAASHVVYSENEENDITRVLDATLEEGVTFDAIMTMESMMSLSALKYCQSKGMSVPEDVGILCFSNAPYLEKMSPSITGVNLNPDLMGAEAFQLLYDLIHDKPKASVKKSVTLPSEILERQSTQRVKLKK